MILSSSAFLKLKINQILIHNRKIKIRQSRNNLMSD
jgi:hypothetical protein